MENRYNHAKVYKIVDEDLNFYIGSTCKPLYKRLYFHKSDSKASHHRKVYKVLTYEKFEKKEIKIILLEQFNLNSKEELLREEDKYIKMFYNDTNCLNSNYAILNEEKYNNNTRKRAYDRFIQNKELVYQINMNYRINHRKELREKQKQYAKDNINKIKQYKKEYYEKNKDILKLNFKEKITCSCGTVVTKNHMKRHEKSNKHIDFINSKSA